MILQFVLAFWRCNDSANRMNQSSLSIAEVQLVFADAKVWRKFDQNKESCVFQSGLLRQGFQ
jgi:hypothetical protein